MIKAKKRRIAVSVGNFDGFHLGHKKIVRTLKKISEKENLISTIMTFIPSPKVYFKRELNLINTDDQKKRILEELGVDSVVYLNFAEIADMSGEDFISKYLVHKCNMDYIVVGENFRFGKNREYNVDALNNMAKNLGFRVKVVKPEVLNGIRISSSFIRERLAFGEIEEANSMLGKLYCIDGSVVEGEKIGRELGFPTINVKTSNSILPEGVFKTIVEVDDETYDSITNIGSRPTFSGKDIKVESHILGFDKKIYGKKVKVYFQKKIRDEFEFDSKKELIKQIKEDIENLKIDKKALF